MSMRGDFTINFMESDHTGLKVWQRKKNNKLEILHTQSETFYYIYVNQPLTANKIIMTEEY